MVGPPAFVSPGLLPTHSPAALTDLLWVGEQEKGEERAETLCGNSGAALGWLCAPWPVRDSS